MDATSLIGPAVVAAVISGLVSGIGILLSTRTARAIHTEKLAFDREQAERKMTADIELGERKLTADIALAARKFEYDRDLDAWKRRTSLAEEVLADFYQAKDIIDAARSPGSLGGESDTRQKESWETEADSRLLDSYYWPIERLRNKDEFFAQFLARRYGFIALFGSDAGQPFLDLWRIRGEILVSVRMLIGTHQNRHMGSLPEDRKNWETTMGWVRTDIDPIAVRLNAAIDAIEKICRPAIQDIVK
jgi:hypothetical protein